MSRAMRLGLWAALGLALAASAVWWTYRADLDAVRAGLAADSQVFETAHGIVEYARWGEGPPALFIHGAGGGWDQGKLIAEHFVGDGYSWISVSRFGYLRSPLPSDASTAAQADALAALLDHLGVETAAVLGVSGGVPPAIQMAARHPAKVTSLVLLASAPFTPLAADTQDLPVPAWAYQALFSSNFPYWAISRVAPGTLGGIFDVRSDLTAELSPEDSDFVRRMIRSFLPVTDRLVGTENEGAAINPAQPHPAEKITAPTLVVHARDDGINPFPIAEYAARTIPGARLLAFDTGGHLMLGRTEEVREEVRMFLSRTLP